MQKNGQEGVDLCRNNDQIDLVLMDLKMPIMDGYEAIKLIKEFRTKLPIIAQTAYALESDIEKIIESGFDGYLTKPFEYDKLVELVKKTLN
jgi:CheY-like chemotaxis protein